MRLPCTTPMDGTVPEHDAPTAEPPADLLAQADYLFSEHFVIAAGMMARSALEAVLRGLCEANGLELDPKRLRHSVRGATCHALKRANVFDKAAVAEATRLWAVGCAVVHCDADDHATVENFLVDVRQFVEAWTKAGPRSVFSRGGAA